MRNVLSIAFVCLSLGLVACGDDDSTGAGASAEASKTTVKQANSTSASAIGRRPEPDFRVPSGPPPKGLVVEDLIEGIGPGVEEGDRIGVRYIGFNQRTRQEFENSWRLTYKFELGTKGANEGWERGLRGMKVGGRRVLTVPPNLAPFGEDTLIYVIDLVELH